MTAMTVYCFYFVLYTVLILSLNVGAIALPVAAPDVEINLGNSIVGANGLAVVAGGGEEEKEGAKKEKPVYEALPIPTIPPEQAAMMFPIKKPQGQEEEEPGITAVPIPDMPVPSEESLLPVESEEPSPEIEEPVAEPPAPPAPVEPTGPVTVPPADPTGPVTVPPVDPIDPVFAPEGPKVHPSASPCPSGGHVSPPPEEDVVPSSPEVEDPVVEIPREEPVMEMPSEEPSRDMEMPSEEPSPEVEVLPVESPLAPAPSESTSPHPSPSRMPAPSSSSSPHPSPSIMPAPSPSSLPRLAPTRAERSVDSCQAAYDGCMFTIGGSHKVPKYDLPATPDVAFTERIMFRRKLRKSYGRVGVLNSGRFAPEFIMEGGYPEEITTFGLVPTAVKTVTLPSGMGSGITHEALEAGKVKMLRNRCIRIFFHAYQIEGGNFNLRRKNEKACVVFKTSA